MEAFIKTQRWLWPLYLLMSAYGSQVFASEGWSFAAAPEISFLRIDAKDTQGFESSLASKSVVPTLGVAAIYDSSEGWGAYTNLQISSLDLKTASTQDALESSQKTTGGVAVGAKYILSEKSVVGGGFALNQEVFIKRTTGNSLRLVVLDIPAFEIFYRTQIYQSEVVRLGGEASLATLMQGTNDGITTSSGFAWKLALTLTAPQFWPAGELQAYFEQRDQDSNIEKWKSQQLGLNLNIAFGGAQ